MSPVHSASLALRAGGNFGLRVAFTGTREAIRGHVQGPRVGQAQRLCGAGEVRELYSVGTESHTFWVNVSAWAGPVEVKQGGETPVAPL